MASSAGSVPPQGCPTGTDLVDLLRKCNGDVGARRPDLRCFLAVIPEGHMFVITYLNNVSLLELTDDT